MSNINPLLVQFIGVSVVNSLLYFVPFQWILLFNIVCLVVIFREQILIILQTLPRDIRFILRMSKLKSSTMWFTKRDMTLVDAFSITLQQNPKRTCFIFEDKTWTMEEIEERSNRIANAFLSLGYKKGDTVALMMHNCPEYVTVWLGLAKLGVITALINTNLLGQPLEHCFKVANCSAVIFSEQYASVVTDVAKSIKLFQVDGSIDKSASITSLEALSRDASTERPVIDYCMHFNDKLLYIYTSGTTGLPKPAVLPNSRYILAARAILSLLNLKADEDLIYNPLPLYHTAGGALGVGSALIGGVACVIKAKFSASAYIPDCAKYRCTVGLYIGEMCRYILAVPPRPTDHQHQLQVLFGNGLKQSIWAEFVRRFRIPQITEVYGATEGNVNIANLDNRIGAVGCIPKILPRRMIPMAIIKVNSETNLPIRNDQGLCIPCGYDEPGMFIGLIKPQDPMRMFHGYVNERESKKKIIHDVFKIGDSAFVSGDLMVMDKWGYIYFKDRTGDTFRWKGENVSTSEVEDVISSVFGLRDCIVYGVQVGDLEGKAGMVAIVDPNQELDINDFASKLDPSLPSFARPIFLRVIPTVEMTGTYKLKKLTLQKEGFNPNMIDDPIYVRQGSSYVPLTDELYQNILNGTMRL